MPRFDKYDPKAGGFRAALAAEFPASDGSGPQLGDMWSAGLDVNGLVVADGSGQTPFVGVCILTKAKSAGDVIDIMTSGEIVEFVNADGTTADPSSVVYDDGAGSYTATAPAAGAGATRTIGWTVQAERLVVRLGAVTF